MNLIREVKPLEIKRTFVIADHIAHIYKGKKLGNDRAFLKSVSDEEFNKKLADVKNVILKLKESDLDKLVCPEYPKRLAAYDSCKWFVADVSPHEIGVWPRAGSLPLRWTNRSLAETAQKVARGFRRRSQSIKLRPKYAIPNILRIKDHLEQKEKYLYPIVFKTDTGTGSRRRLKMKMKGDIDDGCMRSIALTISGKNSIRVYFGTPVMEE